MYLGILVFYVGSFLALPYLGFLFQTLANAIAYDIRARIEESVVKRAFGKHYHLYAEQTPRLIPWIY